MGTQGKHVPIDLRIKLSLGQVKKIDLAFIPRLRYGLGWFVIPAIVLYLPVLGGGIYG